MQNVTATGLRTTTLSLQLDANKTACFNDVFPKATSLKVSGTITLKGTRAGVRAAKPRTTGATAPTPTPNFCSRDKLLSRGFPERVASRNYKTLNLQQKISGSMAVEPAMRIFNTYYMTTGKSATCGAYSASNSPRDVNITLLSGCSKDVDVKSEYGGYYQTGTTFAVEFWAVKKCANGGAISVVLAGDVGFYSQLDRFEKVIGDLWPELPVPEPQMLETQAMAVQAAATPSSAGAMPALESEPVYVSAPAPAPSPKAPSSAAPRRRSLLASTPPACVGSPINSGCASSMSCLVTKTCLQNTQGIFPVNKNSKSLFTMPLSGSANDVLKYFNPNSFLEAAQYVGGKTVCALSVKGSDLAKACLPQGPLAFLGSAVKDVADIMSTLPVQGDQVKRRRLPPAPAPLRRRNTACCPPPHPPQYRALYSRSLYPALLLALYSTILLVS